MKFNHCVRDGQILSSSSHFAALCGRFVPVFAVSSTRAFPLRFFLLILVTTLQSSGVIASEDWPTREITNRDERPSKPAIEKVPEKQPPKTKAAETESSESKTNEKTDAEATPKTEPTRPAFGTQETRPPAVIPQTTLKKQASPEISPPQAPPPTPSLGDMFSGFFFNDNYALMHNLDYSRDSGWRKTGRFFGNLGLLALGVLSSTLIHELSHLVVAKIAGTGFEWPAEGKFEFSDGVFLPLWRIDRDTSQGAKIAIAWSGFLSNMISTEILLWTPGIPKDNMFVVGMLAHSILNNLFYPVVDLIRGGYGDIQVLREGQGSVPAVHIILILHSLGSMARLFLFEEDFQLRFLPWTQPESRGIDLVWAW